MAIDAWKIRSQVEAIENLPTIPPVLKNLLNLIENPKISLSEIGNFIMKDPALTTRILKVVNSPIYGFPGRVSTISQALILLGLNTVKGVLLGVSVFEVMKKVMSGLWEHSVGCAVTSRIISQKKALGYLEEVSVAALLHDIGKVVMGLKFSNEYRRVLKEAETKDIFIFESERKYFSVDHAMVGAWLTDKWKFPRSLIEVIEYHHKPHLSRNVPVQTAIVHLSDILVRAYGFGFAGDNFVPAINPTVFEMLNLTEEDIKDILYEIGESFGHMEDVILIDL
ncbi:histidine kinase [Dissulfurispira thermophila]|uniref:Histidine kinase n=1 Tax=Dissulfurispira thermophila TaxID=2715679 RepID=A0A7G1H1Y2_9BACT|nr:HDOD domain-containing protein [Dissulfurispira thermophila]BCB96658.1 histidine kinase [Dissulfurispira thermophila]